MFIEIIPDLTKTGEIVSVTFILPTAEELSFEPYMELVNGIEVKTVKKVTNVFIKDEILFKQLKKKAIYLLVINPPDFSWLKCPECKLVPEEIITLIKSRRLKEAAGRTVICCSYCKRYYKIPVPPKSFLKYEIL